MTEERLTCAICGEEMEEPFAQIDRDAVDTHRCYGKLLAHVYYPPEQDPARKRPVAALPKTDIVSQPFAISEQDKVVPLKKLSGWSKVKFDRDAYIAADVTILVRTTENSDWRIFGSMKQVYAYTDPRLGILMRPSAGSFGKTFADVPKAIATVAKPFYRRHKRTPEEKRVERVAVEKEEKAKRLHEMRKPKQLAGSTYGNTAQDNRSKRYFLIESMLKGGTSKEIVERADVLAVKSGLYPKGEVYHSIPSNPANIRNMYEEMTQKWWPKAGIKGRALEKEGVWEVTVIR